MATQVLTHRSLHLSNGEMAFVMVVDVGANSDGKNPGIAHLLEHVLLGFDRFQCEKELKKYEIIGKTGFDTTVYILTTNDVKENVEKCFRILASILNGTNMREFGYNVIKNDVVQEILAAQRSKKKGFYLGLFKKLYGNSDILMNYPVGTLESVMKITYKEICDFWFKTYRAAPYRIAVMSEVDADFIQDKYSMYFRNAFYDSKDLLMSPLNNNKLYIWNFGTGIGIYIKLNKMNFYNKTIEERVAEDMGCALIEEYMPQYIHGNTFVNCHKLRYSKYEQFLSIELYIMDKQLKKDFLCREKTGWLQEFVNFILNSCRDEHFELLRSEYINFIRQYVPTKKEQIFDMANSMIYGDVLFDTDLYIKKLQNIKKDDLYKKILSWFTIT